MSYLGNLKAFPAFCGPEKLFHLTAARGANLLWNVALRSIWVWDPCYRVQPDKIFSIYRYFELNKKCQEIGLNSISVLLLVVGNKFLLNGKVTFFSDPEISSFLPSFPFLFHSSLCWKKRKTLVFWISVFKLCKYVAFCTELHSRKILILAN